jgi:hypothetical protein
MTDSDLLIVKIRETAETLSAELGQNDVRFPLSQMENASLVLDRLTQLINACDTFFGD